MPDSRERSGETRTAGHELHLVLRVHRQNVALPTSCVREILMLPPVTRLVGAPPNVRGVIDVRGDVVPVLDLRVRLGHVTAPEETRRLVELLRAREADHQRWLDELEACVAENREFKLARDPHQCAFGRWYDTYQPENLALEFIWKRFDRPHREIHALANEVFERIGRGQPDAARALIANARATSLASLVRLFADAVAAVERSSHELAVVLERDGALVAVTADAAESVEALEDADAASADALVGDNAQSLVARLGRPRDGDSLVLVLDEARLFPAARAA